MNMDIYTFKKVNALYGCHEYSVFKCQVLHHRWIFMTLTNIKVVIPLLPNIKRACSSLWRKDLSKRNTFSCSWKLCVFLWMNLQKQNKKCLTVLVRWNNGMAMNIHRIFNRISKWNFGDFRDLYNLKWLLKSKEIGDGKIVINYFNFNY